MADEQLNNQGQMSPQQPSQASMPPQQLSPPPANAREVIAAQQAALQQQIQAAQMRDRAQFGPAAEGAQASAPVLGGVFAQASQAQRSQQPPPPQGFNLPQGANARQIAQGIPHAAQPAQQVQYGPGLSGIPHPAYPQQGGMQQPDFSRLPDPSVPQNGVTVQMLAAQAQVQGGPPAQYGQQQYQQPYPQQQSDKPTVLWHPQRNSKLIIELEDSYIGGLPESIEQETNPQAKIIAVLLLEILSLRARVDQLEQGGITATPDEQLASRVYNLEMTLYEQRQALTQQARAVREEAQRQTMLDLQNQQQEQEQQEGQGGGGNGGAPTE